MLQPPVLVHRRRCRDFKTLCCCSWQRNAEQWSLNPLRSGCYEMHLCSWLFFIKEAETFSSCVSTGSKANIKRSRSHTDSTQRCKQTGICVYPVIQSKMLNLHVCHAAFLNVLVRPGRRESSERAESSGGVNTRSHIGLDTFDGRRAQKTFFKLSW